MGKIGLLGKAMRTEGSILWADWHIPVGILVVVAILILIWWSMDFHWPEI